MRALVKLALALALLLPSAAWAQDNEICTLVADFDSGAVVFERGDCDTRVTPASTFKIPLAVIGYNERVLIDDEKPVWAFERGDPDWGNNWKRDTNPTQWMTNSTLWYSQRIARAVGTDSIARDLASWRYGNGDMSGDPGKNNGAERAWISSSLKISPREQAAFMRELIGGRLPVSTSSQARALDLVQPGGEVNGWALFGKTGSAYPRRKDQSFDYARGWGWYLGWAENGPRKYVVVRLNQESQRHSGSIGIIARDNLLKVMGELPEFAN